MAINENNHKESLINFEAATYILYSGGDYKIFYTCFVYLDNNGHYQDEIFDIMGKSFNAPNIDELEKIL